MGKECMTLNIKTSSQCFSSATTSFENKGGDIDNIKKLKEDTITDSLLDNLNSCMKLTKSETDKTQKKLKINACQKAFTTFSIARGSKPENVLRNLEKTKQQFAGNLKA